MTEAEFEAAVVDLAHMFGWKVAGFRPAQTSKGWRTPVKYDGKGWPDLTLVHPQHGIIFAELKSPSGHIEPEQAAWLTLLDTAAGVASKVRVVVWRPSDADEVSATLSAGRVTTWQLT